MVAILRARDHGRVDVVDWFTGCGGTARGVLDDPRFNILVGANHNPLAVETYAANNPTVETRLADLQEIDPIDFPPARILISTPECTNHSGAQAKRIYEQGPSFLDQDVDQDPDWEEGEFVCQERSRATMACSLRYAARHRPEFVLHENVVEVAWWGVQVPGKKRGDGTTYQWWVKEWETLGYEVHPLFLNSAMFGAPQLRDRFIIVVRRNDVPMPDLGFTAPAWCYDCERMVAGRQTWKKRTSAWPLHQWGRYKAQWILTCPHCKRVCDLVAPGANTIIDWSDLGETIGEREDAGRPLAESTLARLERGFDKLGWSDALVTLTRTQKYGSPPSAVTRPMHALTKRHDQALAVPPAMIVEYRNGGTIKAGQRSAAEPMRTVTAQGNHHYLAQLPAAMWAKNNGKFDDTVYHDTLDPFGTVTGRDSTSLVTLPDAFLSPYYGTSSPSHVHEPVPTVVTKDRFALVTPNGKIDLRDVHFRMLTPAELQAAQTFPADYWISGNKRERVQQIGDAVPPVLAHAVAVRLGDALEGAAA